MSGWNGPIKNLADLQSPDSPGAQPYGISVSGYIVSVELTTPQTSVSSITFSTPTFQTTALFVTVSLSFALLCIPGGSGLAIEAAILVNGVTIVSGGTGALNGTRTSFAMTRRVAVTPGVPTVISVFISGLQAQALTLNPGGGLDFAALVVTG